MDTHILWQGRVGAAGDVYGRRWIRVCGTAVLISACAAARAAGTAPKKTDRHGSLDGGHNRAAPDRYARNLLIPPPPPAVPSGGVILGAFSVPPELMSPEQLKKRKTELELSSSKAEKDLSEKMADLEDKKQRAEQFETLFTEGVVSKKELEASKKEIPGASDLVELAKQNIGDLHQQLAQVKQQLGKLSREQVKGSALNKTKPARKKKL